MADDHELVRDGFAAMIEINKEFELVGQASNGEFLVSLVRQYQPDVVVTDIQMPVMSGLEATGIIKKQFPDMPIIAMSMYDENYSIMEMLSAGATGYIAKNSGKQVIYEAIRAAYTGENYYCRNISEKLTALITSRRFDPRNLQVLDFNATELRVIRLICEGLESSEISEKLSLSPVTLKKMRLEIMSKTDSKSSVQLMHFALKNGIFKV
jgi:DNA-binding NarL/FixJ family response regulator